MADVTLVFGNSDRLLPIDFETVELGRRLFRSGENDYLLNKQRVRLKDLVDLLDSAHLADNAFLFIGQGMVDQALALRPEERRPLFEEVAGVRRHERRKAKAEDQLVEAEANLARVEDVLAELRPQARRLGGPGRAAGLTPDGRSRIRPGDHLPGHGRAGTRPPVGLDRGRASSSGHGTSQTEVALAALREAEESRSRVARELASGSDTEARTTGGATRRRGPLSRTCSSGTRARRATWPRPSATGSVSRRNSPPPKPISRFSGANRRRRFRPATSPLPSTVAEAERSLAEALEELAAIRAAAAGPGRSTGSAATRRGGAGGRSRDDSPASGRCRATGRRRARPGGRRRPSLAEAEKACLAPRAALFAKAVEDEKAAVAAREVARAELDRREGARQTAAERPASAASQASPDCAAGSTALQARLAEDEARGISRAARRVGGRALSDGLEVEAGFRVAVEAALGEAMRGYVVGTGGRAGLEGQRGVLVLAHGGSSDEGRRGPRGETRDRLPRPATPAAAAAARQGGGRLVDAIRVDPVGAASRLLARVSGCRT